MATNTALARSGDRALAKVFKYLGKSTTLSEVGTKNPGKAKRKIWYAQGTPSTLQAQYATQPHPHLQIGDLCIDTTNKLIYVCTVDCAVSTDATWTLISVD